MAARLEVKDIDLANRTWKIYGATLKNIPIKQGYKSIRPLSQNTGTPITGQLVGLPTLAIAINMLSVALFDMNHEPINKVDTSMTHMEVFRF